jgi:hypothetical protein
MNQNYLYIVINPYRYPRSPQDLIYFLLELLKHQNLKHQTQNMVLFGCIPHTYSYLAGFLTEQQEFLFRKIHR